MLCFLLSEGPDAGLMETAWYSDGEIQQRQQQWGNQAAAAARLADGWNQVSQRKHLM